MSAIKDVIAKGLNVVHRTIFDATKGRVGGSGLGMPVLKLTTTGAKSGQPRTVMLTSPIQFDDKVVIVASYGGDDRSPAWFHNIKANPQAEITFRGKVRPVTGRIPGPDERDRLWTEITDRYGNYASYQKRTDRVIPVVVLEP